MNSKQIVSIALSALVLLSALTSCDKKLPRLDVTKSYPQKNIWLQDIATVEYIPLETTDDFLLDAYATVQYVDEDILVTNTSRRIMIFDRKTGKGLCSFSRQGRGLGEYPSAGSILIDSEAGEMFVAPGTFPSSDRPVYVYDLEGKHLRTLETGFHGILGQASSFHVYDEEYLFSWDSDKNNPKPYNLISRTDGTSAALPIAFATRDDMYVEVETETGTYRPMGSGPNVLKTREGYIFSEPGVDTVYSWNKSNRELTPLMVRTPSFASMEYPVAVYATGQSDDYLFLRTTERRWDAEKWTGFATKNLIYDKKKGRFYEGEIYNGDYLDGRTVSLPGSVWLPGVGGYATTLVAYSLIDKYGMGALQGPLAEVASKLNEQDNPVVMLFTLK